MFICARRAWLLLPFILSACGSSVAPADVTGGPGTAPSPTPIGNPPPLSAACVEGTFCVGAAKRSITPTQLHIDGVEEPRLFGAASHLQRFNLGGFGINPLQNFPDPVAGFGDQLTQPAGVTAHENAEGHVEDTGLRAMLVSLPGADSVMFISVDAVGAGNIIQDRLRQEVAAATGLPAANVLFGQTHSHAGADLQGLWGGVPQDWIENVLYPAAVSAALEALSSALPARLRTAQGDAPQFNNYRRPLVDEAAEADSTMTLLQATAIDTGVVIGSLLQYNAHPTTLNEDPRAPHADYVLGATDWLESLGGVALYFNGPIADASPSGSRPDCSFPDDARYGVVRCRGEGIADVALGFIGAGRELAPTLEVAHAEAVLPVTNPLFLAAGILGSFNRYYDFLQLPLADIPFIGEELASQLTNLPQLTPTASTPVSRITLGGAEAGLEIVTIPGETTNTFGQYIRGLAAPGAQVMLLGLTQNSFGYILPEDEFDFLDRPDRTGLFIPGTNYEEFVSLGPLTAPLLRLQAYNPLFGISATDPANLPPLITACFNSPADPACGLSVIGRRIDYYQRSYAEICRSSGAPENFCSLLDPDTPLAGPCRQAGLPDSLCSILGSGGEEGPGGAANTGNLAVAAIDSLVRGCDPLDPAACLYPFPSNHHTVAAEDAPTIRTGRRINFNPLAMPRNIVGKPIDPSEWNRNDGFSPGPMILTVVPGLDSLDALKLTFGLPTTASDNLVGITHPALSLEPTSPIQLLEVGDDGEVRPALAWAELDVQASNYLLSTNPFGLIPEPFPSDPIDRPPGVPVQTSLIIRPARNLTPGSRYVVVLRSLRDGNDQPISAQPLFAACRDRQETSLPPLQARCEALESSVFPVLERAGIARDPTLYLAWDFTVASTENTTARLVHMRDQAFADLASDGADCSRHIEANMGCAPPDFEIDADRTEGGFRIVEGNLSVPSFTVLPDASPLDDPQLVTAISAITGLAATIPGVGDALSPLLPVISSASLPPNRLFYSPFDGGIPTDPALALYGDGLPDRLGGIARQNTRFICRIPEEAYAADAPAYRPSLYGHGLLGGRGEVGAGNVNQFAAEHGMVFCAIDWFGFAAGDVPNVAIALLDMSSFAVVPDASQQGFINKMFMARLMQHPQGLVSHPAFRKVDTQGTTVSIIDRREIFYDGNSQGGILSGPLLAVSKDLNRGVFGVPGMNYSTLLRRSVDFTPYSTPLYLSYPGELDRNLIFGLIQMLWDRSENNGYMAQLADGSLDGQDNFVLLHPAYGDHQVSTWTSDVIARTIGAPTDRRRVLADRAFPDVDHSFELPNLQSVNQRADGSAQVYFLQPGVVDPPIDEDPPVAGTDPHGYPRAQRDGQCQKSHFLRHEGFVADTLGLDSVAACIARFGNVPTEVQPIEMAP